MNHHVSTPNLSVTAPETTAYKPGEAYFFADDKTAEIRIPLNSARCDLMEDIMEAGGIPAPFRANWLAKQLLATLVPRNMLSFAY